MNQKKKLIIILITVFTIATLGGLTYAFFSANNVENNSTTNTIVTLTADYGNVIVTYHNSNGTISTENMDLKQSEVGNHKEYLMRFKIQNTANIIHDISINWSNVTSNFCQYQNDNICTNNNTHKYVGDELNYSLYECPTETLYNNATLANVYSTCKIAGTPYRSVPLTGETLALQDSKKISLSPESTKYYVFVLRMENLNKNQNYNQDKNFSGRIKVEYADGWEEDCEANPNRLNCQIITRSNPEPDDIASTYVTSASGINFGAISSLTNGQGLYRNYKLEDGENYYFRGGSFCAYTNYINEEYNGPECATAGGTWIDNTCSYDLSKSACEGAGFTWHELNNNVKFANKYWKIIRIDEQGNIRLLYNGNATNATGTDTLYGNYLSFNNSYNDAAYVGYMIPEFTGNTTSIEEATNNDKDSTIKGVVDNFYNAVLSSYTNKIADVGYCGDRSITSGPGFGASTTDWTYYGSWTRLVTNKTPTYKCQNSNDLYTTKTSLVGNKRLTKPIGLVTIDETLYAGNGGNISNYTYYMQNGVDYWTMSPLDFRPDWNFQVSRVWGVEMTGTWYSGYVYDSLWVRPAVSLKSETAITNGTGTLTDPYIIN